MRLFPDLFETIHYFQKFIIPQNQELSLAGFMFLLELAVNIIYIFQL